MLDMYYGLRFKAVVVCYFKINESSLKTNVKKNRKFTKLSLQYTNKHEKPALLAKYLFISY